MMGASQMQRGQQYLERLQAIRAGAGRRKTVGLGDQDIAWFLDHDPRLQRAIDLAWNTYNESSPEFRQHLSRDEESFINFLQDGFVNFYEDNAVNPYVPLNASGPWIITWYGAVLHETGGYGMLGSGHNPEHVFQAMAKPYVMANIMTASVSQSRLVARLQREIGHRWKARNQGKPAFSKFLCLNSGSESVTIASRIADVNAKELFEGNGRAKPKTRKFLALKGAFHGRTERPAQVSDSSMRKYKAHLASFAELDNLLTVGPNDTKGLAAAFEDAERKGIFIEAMFVEPVMGEGNPGMAMTPEFYDKARALTLKHGSLLIVDSIQAGIRAQGCLSIVDYPGFEACQPPDMETYSKAVNAGQYPLSILGMSERAAGLYRKGIYGNTMTANPRALEVACAVLDGITDQTRLNIRERGREFADKLRALQAKYPDVITSVQGTGLLLSAELNPKVFDVVAAMGIETYLRINGINVIHGGKNAIRLTPCFDISSAEIDLVVGKVDEAIRNAPRKS